MALKGRITPITGTTTMTGLRPTMSDRPGTTKLVTVADMPSVPISQPMVCGSNPRTLVRYSGRNAQVMTR